MKKAQSIETLLRWAFRDELSRGKPVSASPWSIIEEYAKAGTRIDHRVVGGGDGLGFVPGEPHPDAKIIAECVAALPARVMIGEDRMIDLLAEFAHRDETGRYAIVDALDVRAVALAPFSPKTLVIRCAVLGKAMVWDIGRPQLEPMMVMTNGRERRVVIGRADNGEMMLLDPDRSGRYSHALHRAPRSELRWSNPPMRHLAETRAEFTVWHDALVMLAAAINKRGLADQIALAPMLPAEPWRVGVPAAPAKIVHRVDVPNVSTRPLPLQPKRKAALRPHESEIERTARLALRRASSEKRKKRKTDGPVIDGRMP